VNRPEVLGSHDDDGRPSMGLPASLAPASGGARDTLDRVSRSGWTVAVLGALTSLVLASGIVVAASFSGGGPQPEEVLPGTAFAFAKVDFDPPASQKLAVRSLARRFPDAPSDELSGLKDDLVESLLDDADVGLDFERDVKAWLGDRAGLAAFRDAAGDAKVVVAIQADDEDEARAAITRAANDVAVDFRKGYALTAEDPATLAAALRLVDEGSLSDADGYRSDRARLGGDQLAVAWADAGQLGDLLVDELADVDPEEADQLRAGLTGRTVIGVHAEDRAIEIEALTIGADRPRTGRPDHLLRLPDDTVGAGHLHDAAGLLPGAGEALGSAAGGFPLGAFGGVPAEVTLGFGLNAARGPAAPAHNGDVPGFVMCPPGKPASTGRPVPGEIYVIEPDVECFLVPVTTEGRGLRLLSEEVVPLLTAGTTVAIGAGGRDAPEVGAILEATRPGDVVAPLTQGLRLLGLTDVQVTTDGPVVVAASTPEYAGRIAAGGRLGESDRFRRAMGGLDDRVALAVYVDLDAVAELIDEPLGDAEALAAVGLVVRQEDDVSRMTVRLTLDE
jgi:hypothetical protein